MRKDEPSRTAKKIAMGLVTLAAKPETANVLPPGSVQATEELLIATDLAGPRTLRLARSKLTIAIYDAFDWLLPGQFEALAHRKAYFEGQVRAAIASGARQVLVLGAGFDTLCWRLAREHSDVRFFEIDHPATSRMKTRGIEEMGRLDNHNLVAEDLSRRSLAETLRDIEDWDVTAPSIATAEGLLMYMPAEAVAELFTDCAAVCGKGSRIAFSYIPTGKDGRPDAGKWTGLVLWLQTRIGEPWLWSIRPDDLGSYVRQFGWTLDRGPDDAREKFGIEFFEAAMN